MRILEVALPGRPVLPEDQINYQAGAIEILISLLAKGFRALGHECDVFCSGESPLLGNFHISLFERDTPSWDRFAKYLYEYLCMNPYKYDIIHFHGALTATNPLFKPFSRVASLVYTWHDSPLSRWGNKFAIEAYYDDFPYLNIVSISNFQKRKIERKIRRSLPRVKVIYNGLDISQYRWDRERTTEYFAVSRITLVKGVHILVHIARATNITLNLAGNVFNRKYFATHIKPLLTDKVRYVGPVYVQKKRDYFETCAGFLNTPIWDEPFGLTIVEALASGAPIVSFARGAIPEILGDCGILVNNPREFREVLKSGIIKEIDPLEQRKRATRFNYMNMCVAYIDYFKELLEK